MRARELSRKSYLGEDGGPDGLNLDVGGLDQSLELVGLKRVSIEVCWDWTPRGSVSGVVLFSDRM